MNNTRRRAIAVVAAGLIALGACGGDDDSNDDASPVETEETAARGDTGTDEETDSGDSGDTDSGDTDSGDTDSAGDGVASIMLNLIEGGEEDTYNVTVESAGCSRNPTGEGTFGLQYMADEQEGFHSFQIEIDDRDAAATGTDQFSATARVGETRYHFDRGDALITLEDEGDTAKIIIMGTTEDGVDVSAVVDCHSIVDL